MRLILIICLITTFAFSQNSNENNETILWDKNIKLTWADFKGKPLSKEKIGLKKAETCSEIIIKAKLIEGQIPNFTVISIFHKKDSWTITKSKDILKHEKSHFDITEIYARKIRACFKNLNNSKVTDYQIYIDKYHELRKKEVEFQIKYDQEVLFNTEKQKKWYIEIAKQLEELKDYSL